MASNSLLIKQAIKSYELGELSHAAKICLGLVKADANNLQRSKVFFQVKLLFSDIIAV